VRERERERERERTAQAMLNVLQSDQLNVSKATIITSNLVVGCVTRDRNREINTANVAGHLSLYPLEITEQ
jgi:hypothetical protein